ncbi:RagB/SusD family nutrient uptake outer membrane protein [Flavobacterium gawalongense]|uniref:RagB/SusD family nutrient uptake outer membrane protein n=1 Tax=Flavobacterium gawalongense TaxID=2594432 RepID=A0A553BKE8_9FLAO|nr:RagB/SusD family nutrient uptake outer membrane protein [Flavobacterium gawalongense]TRX04017.1 RagB/SusD family nutrient uptake outer membrane protein [Flavobacterium gawalongense]TRX07195.1 RagB/SusD family nutrient uptake outer membrane protein [Flavobacterium gawalongense]TRX08726.1 RagB/SusD family nutrient uptake outer membrane protein [Flavobacterium gawalongense]TRX09437.1 RagB/SusD family nutrient uptake outer membrane protein [Flavobacterium gawalongense]TRX25408.1 RagB/SusD famil
MKKIICSVMVIFFMTVSCSSDFTEVAPVGVLESTTFFNSESNTEEALIGLYDLVQFNNNAAFHSAFFIKVLPGDEANAGGGNATDQKQLQEIDDYANISISNPSLEAVWNKEYKTIALANTIIENVEAGNLSNKTFAIAEAKFMRAWCYFELTTMWGDVPLRLENPTTISAEAFAKPKSTRAEIYTQIKADLTDAIAGLPDKTAVKHNFRVSKGAAQALLGKVLVFEGKTLEAIPYLKAVIDNPAHGLESDVSKVWLKDSEFGKESLFEVGFITTKGYDWSNQTIGGRFESNIFIQLMGARGDGYFNLTGTGLRNGWGFNLPTAKILNAFDTAGDVNRKAATVMSEAELNAFGGSLTGTPWDYEGGIRTKYAARTSETSSGGVAALNYGTNLRLFRYAEVLLLAAEAYNKEGQDDKARIELNKIRNRAGLADVSSSLTGANLFNAIVNEKFLELAFEGQRFWDLVRWGRATAELSSKGYTSKNNLYPIPASEIAKNKALTSADQNPGY